MLKDELTLMSWSGEVAAPPGLAAMPFQLRAARWALTRKHSYLALDPGLGKTICAALIINALGSSHRFVYFAPPFLVLNTANEFAKWCPGVVVHIWGETPAPPDASVLIVPDSLLYDPFGARESLRQIFKRVGPRGVLFVDESHRYKTDTARRTRAVFGPRGFYRYFSKVVCLSGTPMPNRPMELFTIASALVPEAIDYRNKHRFGMKYCAGYHDGFGYDYTGASNVEDLGARLKASFMLRLRTEDVLPELPPLLEELVLIGDKLPAEVAAVERAVLSAFSPLDLMKTIAPNGHVSTYRRLLGSAKVKPAAEYIKGLLNDTDEAVLVFAEHVDCVARLEKELAKFNPVVITGSVPKDERQKRVDQFQRDDTRRVFIGNVKACGVGFTLTKATRVVFVEFSWPPGDNEQAAKRAHRIGTTSRVLIQYLIFKNSIDRVIMESNLAKRKNQSHI